VTYGPSTYGDRIAEIYDHAYPDLPTGETVDFLAERFGGWKREAFSEASGHHVSVYEREPK
jgi:hypothetical protein